MTGLAERSPVPTAARCTVAWLLMSGGFGVYLREIASYGSIFSSLAAVVVLMAYEYLSAAIFLGGIQIDALVREQQRKAFT